jgi:hypothetical protein
MSVKLNSSGGGSVTLQEPSTASDRTLTLPDNTGTVVSTASTAVVSQAMLASGVAGNGPAFSAYATAAQTVTNGVVTKVILGLENFDTANCFDSATNYRFTPNVAGYYQINGAIYGTSLSLYTVSCLAVIYKNGSAYLGGAFANTQGSTGSNAASSVCSLIYMNGTTDYVELYGYLAGTGTLQLQNTSSLGLMCQFSGSLMRAA